MSNKKAMIQVSGQISKS